MEICYENLRIQKLQAPITISNYVNGIDPYSYEDYLLDFMNQSPYFRTKSKGKQYIHIIEQSHGECDCVSANYAIDFKLFSSRSLLQHQKLHTSQIYLKDGWLQYCDPKKPREYLKYNPFHSTRIFVALRNLTIDQLESIAANRNGKDTIARDIYYLLHNLQTNKNLLMFFPYNFYFAEAHDFDKGLGIILKAVSSDFRNALQYRCKHRPDKDTYLCFLYRQQMVLTEWKGANLQFVEALPLETSPLFVRLLLLTDDPFLGGSLK